MIRNKYNGYGFDGSRLYHDPISLSIAATKAGAASSAAAAATAAATKAAAGTAAAQTAGLELAKKAAIQESMKQVAAQGAKQAGVEAAKQSAVEASKQGIAQGFQKMIPQVADDAASLATQSGSDAVRNQAIEAFKQSQANPNRGVELGKYAGDVTSLPAGPSAPAGPLSPAGSTPNLEALKAQTIQSGSPSVTPSLDTLKARVIQSGSPIAPESQLLAEQAARMPSTGGNFPGIKMTPDKAFGPESSGIYKGRNLETGEAFETLSRPSFNPPTGDGSGLKLSDTLRQSLSQPQPESSLAKGAREAMDWMGKNKLETGLGLMTVGQYMNQPKGDEEDKDKYKSTVDMSDFRPTIPEQPSFTRSYEYQNYQAGGPVEDMSRMNSIGANTGFPMAGLQTPAYSVSSATPMPVNTLTPTADASVSTYNGEARFAEGGLSAAQRREYGLRTRGERASRDLSKSYEEMEEARQREAMKLFNESSLPTPRPIARSRTQELSSPFSAAMTEHARLGKRAKVPVVPMPKTNLGDIDNYMDIPIEAASGGIMHGLGGYSDGGRLLRGPGDGVSDSIPAVIGKRQPARLADGEFVIPARIVSELGNGSTEAGARKLYAMMERVQNTRKKSIGKKKVAVNSKADKHLPA
jgi:hypothetical protein